MNIIGRLISLKIYLHFPLPITTAMKKILTYVLMFIAFSLCGLLFAFAWNKFVPDRGVEPSQTSHPAPDLEQTRRTHKAPGRPVTEPTTSAPHTPVEQSVSPAHPAPAVLPTPKALPAAPADAGSGCDIVLLIDSSGTTTIFSRTGPGSFHYPPELLTWFRKPASPRS
jgi:hypothetical protein